MTGSPVGREVVIVPKLFHEKSRVFVLKNPTFLEVFHHDLNFPSGGPRVVCIYVCMCMVVA